MVETLSVSVRDSYNRACDSCPFRDECKDYKEAFGTEECLRDDWARSLLDYLKETCGDEICSEKLNPISGTER